MTIEITADWITEHDVEGGPVLQARVNAGHTTLHLQGYGKKQNRPYGFAEKFKVPHEMTQWLMTGYPNTYVICLRPSVLHSWGEV